MMTPAQKQPGTVIMMYAFCCCFLLGAIALSIQFQLESVFKPLFNKHEIAVFINPNCAIELTNFENNVTVASCLKCKRMPELTELKKCSFTTSNKEQSKTAKTMINNHGLSFNVKGYIVNGKGYLQYDSYPFLFFHLFILIFGVLPFYFVAHTTKRKSWSWKKY